MKRLYACAHCEKMFVSVNPYAECCSAKCRKKRWEKVRREKRRADAFIGFNQRPQNVTPFDFPLPDAPTDAPPGSSAKVAVFQERIKRKQRLHHPDDVTMDALPDFIARLAYAIPHGRTQAYHVDYLKIRAEKLLKKREGAALG